MTLEELTLTVVDAQPGDLMLLARIHESLKRLGASSTLPENARKLAGDVAAQVESVILRECATPAEVVGGLGAVVSMLRTMCGDETLAGALVEQAPSETGAADTRDPDADVMREFIGEATEHLDGAERTLLGMEAAPRPDDEGVNSLFRAFHNIKGASSFIGLPQVARLAHATETVLERIRQGHVPLEGPCADAVLDAVDMLRTMIDGAKPGAAAEPAAESEELRELLERLEALLRAPAGPRIGDLVVERGLAPREKVEEIAARDGHGRLGEKLVRAGVVRPEDIEDILRVQRAAASGGETTVRFSVRRLDELIDATAKLEAAQQALGDELETDSGNGSFAEKVRGLGRMTREIRDRALSMRRVPLDGLFQKTARLVRDVARRSRKRVRLACTGGHAEVDRGVAEALGDPLLHMIRNAIDHGIEPAEERLRAGKPAEGLIALRARREPEALVIELEDDGRGLDAAKIRAKAVETGLIDAGSGMSESETFELLFAPGFSTADVVTEVSGRGVGLDVVRRNIEAVRGSVEVRSAKGRGTTFVLRVPVSPDVPEGPPAASERKARAHAT